MGDSPKDWRPPLWPGDPEVFPRAESLPTTSLHISVYLPAVLRVLPGGAPGAYRRFSLNPSAYALGLPLWAPSFRPMMPWGRGLAKPLPIVFWDRVFPTALRASQGSPHALKEPQPHPRERGSQGQVPKGRGSPATLASQTDPSTLVSSALSV